MFSITTAKRNGAFQSDFLCIAQREDAKWTVTDIGVKRETI